MRNLAFYLSLHKAKQHSSLYNLYICRLKNRNQQHGTTVLIYGDTMVSCRYIASSKFNLLWCRSIVVIVERISVKLWISDLFSQCTYVRVCHAQECQFALTCMQSHVHWQPRIPDAMSRTTWLVLCNVRVLWSWVLNATNGWRYWERESNKDNVSLQ